LQDMTGDTLDPGPHDRTQLHDQDAGSSQDQTDGVACRQTLSQEGNCSALS